MILFLTWCDVVVHYLDINKLALIWEWISNFIPYCKVDVITYQFWSLGFKFIHVSEWAQIKSRDSASIPRFEVWREAW